MGSLPRDRWSLRPGKIASITAALALLIAASIIALVFRSDAVPPAADLSATYPTPPGRLTAPPGLTAMLTGDSVADRLFPYLDARAEGVLGWNVVNASFRSCSLMGDPLAWPDGTDKSDPTRCDGVMPRQDEILAASAPDIVIWWDRLSQMPFMTRDDPPGFMQAGSDRFWSRRKDDIRARAQRFADAGAAVVFVETEPMGIGVYQRCRTWDETRNCEDWVRFRMQHYLDITRRWNFLLRAYATNHPDHAVFISITDDVCRADVSPCDDRIDGTPARRDGTHYKDEGALKAARVLIHDIRLALYPR